MNRIRSRNFMQSLAFSAQGLLHAYRSQRNIRVHILMGVLISLVAAGYQLDRVEWAVLVLAIGLVIAAELINTAIETAIDLITVEYHPLAAIAKNVAAAAVLTAAFTAALVGYFLFFHRLAGSSLFEPGQIVATPLRLTILSLVLVLIIVVAIKLFTGSIVKIQGGMPSGHAAVAFSLATAVLYTGRDATTVLLAATIAFLVAESRVEGRIHNIGEVLAGALIGVAVTAAVFTLIG